MDFLGNGDSLKFRVFGLSSGEDFGVGGEQVGDVMEKMRVRWCVSFEV